MCDMITDVRQEKQNILIVINETVTLRIDRSQYSERPFSVGEKIDLEEFLEWLALRQYPSAINDAIGFLAARVRSALEVRQKLMSKGYWESTIDLVLYKLEKEGLVNDEQFAYEWSRARIRRQYGSARILWELKRKGIRDTTASQSLEKASIDLQGNDDNAMINSLAEKLLRRVRNDPNPNKAMRKVLSAMVRRGFSYDDASAAIQASLAVASSDEDS